MAHNLQYSQSIPSGPTVIQPRNNLSHHKTDILLGVSKENRYRILGQFNGYCGVPSDIEEIDSFPSKRICREQLEEYRFPGFLRRGDHNNKSRPDN